MADLPHGPIFPPSVLPNVAWSLKQQNKQFSQKSPLAKIWDSGQLPWVQSWTIPTFVDIHTGVQIASTRSHWRVYRDSAFVIDRLHISFPAQALVHIIVINAFTAHSITFRTLRCIKERVACWNGVCGELSASHRAWRNQLTGHAWPENLQTWSIHAKEKTKQGRGIIINGSRKPRLTWNIHYYERFTLFKALCLIVFFILVAFDYASVSSVDLEVHEIYSN